ncbi:MAG: hypothetical protein ABIN79_05620 [Marmoricola sp.]
MKILRGVALALVSVLAVAGCGDRPTTTAVAAEQAITPRAIAAVMLDHLPPDTTRREATYVDETSPRGYVGADFRYDGGGESDGDLVRVTLQRRSQSPSCEDVGCADLGDGVKLYWEEEVPEEDPGIVVLVRQLDDGVLHVLLAGPTITGDPRRQELKPTLDALTDLVTDRRLALRTSAETIAAGREVTDWEGGERDPTDLEQVPNDDRTVVTGFVYGWGDDWSYVGPAPGKKQLGAGSVGGRARVGPDFGPVGPGLIDALAAPRPPDWLETCLPRYQCWSRGPSHFVWRAAMGAAGCFLFGQSFHDRDEPLSVGLTTTRSRYEQAKVVAPGPG